MLARILSHTHTLMPIPIIYRVMDSGMRRQFGVIYMCMILTGLFEMLVIANIGMFVSTASDPTYILQSPYYAKAAAVLGLSIDSVGVFQPLLGVTLIVLQLLKMGIRSGTDFLALRYAARIDTIMGERLMARVLALDYQDTKIKYNQAEIFSFVSWRTFFGTDYMKGGLQALQSSTISVVLFAGLITAYPYLTLATFILFGGLGGLIFRFIGPKVDKAVQQYLDGNIDVSHRAGMIFSGLREIKLASLERVTLPTFVQSMDSLVWFRTLQTIMLRFPYHLMETCGIAAIVVIVCLLRLSEHTLGQTTVTAAIFAVSSLRILSSVNNILCELTAMRIAIPYIQRIQKEFPITEPVELPPPVNKDDLWHMEREIRVENLGFSYPTGSGRAIDGLSFIWPKGTSLGIIGLSGSGKSTLIDLLTGLFTPSEGHVTCDGTPVHGKDRSRWMRSIGYVAQHPVFFKGTLADNIALQFDGTPPDEERLAKACALANLDFIDDSPEGLDMELGENAGNLSGGQRQRLTIARALYPDPPLLVMDEPTSAMDLYNETLFMDHVRTIAQNRSVAIISHKLSTIRFCDLVLWLERGKARMFGPATEVIPAFERFVEERSRCNE